MIEQIDNLLTKEECNQIIDYGKSLDMDTYDVGRYYFSNIMKRGQYMETAFSHHVLQPAYWIMLDLSGGNQKIIMIGGILNMTFVNHIELFLFYYI